jgi:hypothetical protein
LVDRANGGDAVHDVGPASIGPDRQPAADDLAERRQVGLDPEPLLSPSISDTEPGHHLIHDEHRSVFGTQVADRFQEPRLG